MRSELQNVLESLRGMTPEQLPNLLGELEVIRTTAMMRLTSSAQTPQADKLIGIDEAADRLGISKDYLYRHKGEYPFLKRMGGKILFSSAGIEAFIRKNRG